MCGGHFGDDIFNVNPWLGIPRAGMDPITQNLLMPEKGPEPVSTASIESLLTRNPEFANYAVYGSLMQQNLKRKRRNVKTSALGLEDEDTQMKALTGQ